MRKWGFLRETKEKAKQAGIDADTGIVRTGLEEYLAVIFPDVNDWIHDQMIDNLPCEQKSRRRPDYRSESLKLIIEFDGKQHYTSPDKILDDEKAVRFYTNLGYKVVRIPYFIQLTNATVKKMFGVTVNEPLFDETIPSIGSKGKNSPAYLCGAGVVRMAKDFSLYPEQYLVNIAALKRANNEYLTGASLLENCYNKLL